MPAAVSHGRKHPMPSDYKPPTRLSNLLRSGALFWSAFAVVVVLLGGYALLALH